MDGGAQYEQMKEEEKCIMISSIDTRGCYEPRRANAPRMRHAMSTQLHLSKGFEIHVAVVSVRAMCTPAERFSGGREHPMSLFHSYHLKQLASSRRDGTC